MRNASLVFFLFVSFSGIRANNDYTHHWVAKIEGGENVARRVAEENGYFFRKQLHSFDDHYVLIKDGHPIISKESSPHLTRSLLDVKEVKWAEQQRVSKVALRNNIPDIKQLQVSNPKNLQSLIDQLLQSGAEADIAITIRKHVIAGNPNSNPNSATLNTAVGGNVDNPAVTELLAGIGNRPNSAPVITAGGGNTASPLLTGVGNKPNQQGNKPAGTVSYGTMNGKPIWLDAQGNVHFVNEEEATGSSGLFSTDGLGNRPAPVITAGGGNTASPLLTGVGNKPNQQGNKPAGAVGYGTMNGRPIWLDAQGNVHFVNDGEATGLSGLFSTGVDQGDTSKLGTFTTDPVPNSLLKTYEGPTKHVHLSSRKRSAYAERFNDPNWPDQWYTQDQRTTYMPVMDHNVVPVYNLGFTGKGVMVAVVDDGLLGSLEDLKANYLKDLSVNMIEGKEGDSTPTLNQETNKLRSHGTKCASEIAMVADNRKCGVGIAYNAKVAGVKKSGAGGPIPIYVQSDSLAWRTDVFDIYSCSWGPVDDGKTMEEEGELTDIALHKGVTEGRKGKGSLYFFAGGNGRDEQDNCYADGLVNHLYTMGVASASNRGKVVYYSERCSAIFVATYSGGNRGDEAVHTVEMDGSCAGGFSGTSAATPIASGITALLLESKPGLTYRDVMHLIAWTSEVAPLANNEGIWYKNGAGFWVCNDFGFGLMNAGNLIAAAKNWQNVPKKNVCIITVAPETAEPFGPGNPAIIDFNTVACQNSPENAVKYLEQLMVTVDIQYPYRGAITIDITSPMGTKTQLAEVRPLDNFPGGLQWTIKSVRTWGENPKGKWIIEVKAVPLQGLPTNLQGSARSFTLAFHGTEEKPKHYENKRKYAAFRLPDGQSSE